MESSSKLRKERPLLRLIESKRESVILRETLNPFRMKLEVQLVLDVPVKSKKLECVIAPE